MSDIKNDVHRNTYDMLGVFANFGGVQKALLMVLTPFVAGFAKKNLLSMMANRFYTQNSPYLYDMTPRC